MIPEPSGPIFRDKPAIGFSAYVTRLLAGTTFAMPRAPRAEPRDGTTKHRYRPLRARNDTIGSPQKASKSNREPLPRDTKRRTGATANFRSD